MRILDFVLRLGAALLMGVCVGLERQWRQRMPGTHTNALVAAGAAAFVMCGFMVRDNSRGEAQIVSYVVSGIGFLGAGVIFKDAGSIRGLSTRRRSGSRAAIGAISGLGNPLHALILTAAVPSTGSPEKPGALASGSGFLRIHRCRRRCSGSVGARVYVLARFSLGPNSRT